MKLLNTLLIIIAISFSLMSAPIDKLPYKVTQPDGTTIECFVSGDEFFNWIHDNEGYPIIKGSDGYYYYAVVKNQRFAASKYKVSSKAPVSAGLKKMVEIDDTFIKELIRERREVMKIPKKNNPKRSKDEGNTLHTGTINNLVIYIRFAQENNIETPRQIYDNQLNLLDAYSLKSYYIETSYNQLTINSTHYPPVDNPATENFSYQDSHPRSYYQPYDEATNPDGYADQADRTQREHQLLANAIEWINANHPIPNDLNIDADNDGHVDNICFMINGDCDGWSDLLWAHRWALYTQYVYVNGKRVFDYTFQPENQVSARVLCHEMFHVLGAPDLYHYQNGRHLHPAGKWDIMNSGSGHMLAYMKWKYAEQKWITDIPRITQPGRYTLFPATSQTQSCYSISSPNSENQFFVVEYRKFSGMFESLLPSQGMLVYRINNGFNGNANYDGETIFDEVYVYRPDGTATENGIPDSATFSLNSGRVAINNNTNPSSFLCEGTPGGLNIFNVSAIGDSITFNVSFGDITTGQLVVIAEPSNGGNPTGAGEYTIGEQVELRANPSSGWRFAAWTTNSNEVLSIDSIYTHILINQVDTVKAVYVAGTDITHQAIKRNIYPNPVQNTLYFEDMSDLKKVVIYNITGKMVMMEEWRQETNKLDVTTLKAGIYLIEFIDKANSRTHGKFIKL